VETAWRRTATLLVTVIVTMSTLTGCGAAQPVTAHLETAHLETQEDSGVLPGGVTVFDARFAGVTRLDDRLLGALRRAATEAQRSGLQIYVNSGWRSPAYQERLLDEAVTEYGSAAAAARWVATARTSPHVAGEAVDVGGSDAMAWLSRRGAAYGLCQIYRNEPWHYELRAAAPTAGCPAMYADPTRDPRMQQ
jgi:LAS superfamily LD-carboxypeptidase LdcB